MICRRVECGGRSALMLQMPAFGSWLLRRGRDARSADIYIVCRVSRRVPRGDTAGFYHRMSLLNMFWSPVSSGWLCWIGLRFVVTIVPLYLTVSKERRSYACCARYSTLYRFSPDFNFKDLRSQNVSYISLIRFTLDLWRYRR